MGFIWDLGIGIWDFQRKFLAAIAILAAIAAAAPAATPAPNPFTPPNFSLPQFPARAFNLLDYGAKGDGVTNDTPALNAAIAACNAAGGGTITIPAGKYLAASVHLLSNVCLALDPAATITGGPAGAFLPAEPNPYDKYQDFGHSHFHNALFYGEDIENFALLGGSIDGGVIITGDPADGGGDKIFAIIRGKNLRFENTTFIKGGHFVYLLNDCENITIAHNTILKSRDAIDLMGCRNVQIHDNNFTGCSDDTIGIKSDYALGRRITTQNIYAWDCYFETNCNGVQFGSETAGDFYNVNIWNITIGKAGKAGLGITNNDSAIIDGVRMDNITITGATCPIYMLISDRLRTGEPGVTPGVIRNVTLSNITATDCKPNGSNNVMPSAISGLPAYPLENITLENITITMPGGGTEADAAIYNPIYPTDYSPRSIGPLPAAALFARHVRGLTLRNVTLSTTAPDKRIPLVALDVDSLTLDHLDTGTTDAAPARARLDNITNLEILSSPGLPEGITTYTLTNNTQPTTFEAESLPYAITGPVTCTIAKSTDLNPSGGAYLTLNGGTIGTTLAFTLPAIPQGTYNLTVGAKQNNNRATAQLQLDGANLGPPWDQCGSAGAMITKDYGKVTLAAGAHTIAMTITGRSATSTGYTLTADYFRLTPDAATPAAPTVTNVASAPAVAAGDTITITGANLNGANVTVTIGGVPATILSNDGATLQVIVPDNTANGTITITTDAGAITATQTLIITPPVPPAPPPAPVLAIANNQFMLTLAQPANSTDTFSLTSNIPWITRVESGTAATWLTCAPDTSAAATSGTVTLTAKATTANTTGAPRIASLVVDGGAGLTRTLIATQAATNTPGLAPAAPLPIGATLTLALTATTPRAYTIVTGTTLTTTDATGTLTLACEYAATGSTATLIIPYFDSVYSLQFTTTAAGALTLYTFDAAGPHDLTGAFTYAAPPAPPPVTYNLTLYNATATPAASSYEANAKITLVAAPPAAGKIFEQWTTSNGGAFTSPATATTTFTMPPNATTVIANYKPQPANNGNNNTGGSSSSGGGGGAPTLWYFAALAALALLECGGRAKRRHRFERFTPATEVSQASSLLRKTHRKIAHKHDRLIPP